MKIGIIGNGFVGSAVENAFYCEKIIVDPRKTDTTIDHLIEQDPDFVFICLPTPCKEDGSVDGSLVQEALNNLPDIVIKVVKSTVMPEWMEGFEHVVYNPEFLTQRTAQEDFLHPDSLIFGGDKHDCLEVEALYWRYSSVRVCPVFHTDIRTAVLVKYALNSFFATKVTFMNELHTLHRQMCPSSWKQFTTILGADSRMTPNHLQVPGPDGEFGYGGACFPKDTNALLHHAKSIGVDLSVLEQAMKKNDQIR